MKKTIFCILFSCLLCLPALSRPREVEGRKIKGSYSREVIIAASNTPKADQKLAHYVCDGIHDEATINKAIAGLPYGGTITLLDGDYFIDAFPGEDHSAICFGYNEGRARTINLRGFTENKSYNTHFGVVFHVTEKAFSAMDDDTQYRVFYGSPRKPASEGAYFTYTHVNNVNFENFYLLFHNNKKKLIGIDCRNFGNSYIKLVGICAESYFDDRYLHLDPQDPAEGCIGIYSMHESNDEMSRIGFDTVLLGGLYTGIHCKGVEHLIMRTCAAARCVYGYVFEGPCRKTMTMINCCDEGNTHLPKFIGTGQLTCIDFNIERFNADYIPEDVTGDEHHFAVETTPGGWHGFISYTIEGKAFGVRNFWAEGSGKNFRTVNLYDPLE